MVVGVGDDDVLVDAETEAVRRVELAVRGAQLAEADARLHRNVLGHGRRRGQSAAGHQDAGAGRQRRHTHRRTRSTNLTTTPKNDNGSHR